MVWKLENVKVAAKKARGRSSARGAENEVWPSCFVCGWWMET